jgi:hypothetical protein
LASQGKSSFYIKALNINPENRHCATILDTLLHDLAYKETKKTLPILEQIQSWDLDSQLQQKFAKDPNNLDFPDLEEIGITDPNDIIFEQSNNSFSGNQESSFIGMLTRGRLRSRTSNILPSSPHSISSADNGNGRSKRGALFQATSSDQLNPQTSSPPRLARRLFNSRDLGNSSDEGEEETGSRFGINVFADDGDEDGMEVDRGEEST